MVRALSERWEALATHRWGRWLRLFVEVAVYLAMALAIWAHWDAPQVYFSYLGI